MKWRWPAAFALFALLSIEPMWLLRPLGTDDASYFAHGATLALDLDFDYSNEHVIRWSADGRVAAGPPGTGWMAAPFIAAFGIIDRITDHPVIDDRTQHLYSWSFFGMFAAAVVYFLLGVWLYRRALALLWPSLDPRLNVLLAFSTGVPFYVLRRFSMSHAFEFFACALGCWAAIELYRALGAGQSARRWYVWSALAAGLNLAVRINNLNTLLLGPTLLLVLYVFAPGALPRPAWPKIRTALGWLAVAALAGAIPMVLFNLHFFGAAYPSPASMYGQPLVGTATRTPLEVLAYGVQLLPFLVPLLFSSEFGVLYTNPVLVLGGLFLIATLVRRLLRAPDAPRILALLAVCAYFGLSTAVVLWWRGTGSSYGFRYLFPLYPVALVGLMIALRETAPRFRRGALVATLVLASISVVSVTMFSASKELEVHHGPNAFDMVHRASGLGYMTALPAAVVKPRTWLSLAARRLPGFFGAPLVMRGPWRDRVPSSWAESYEDLYKPIPADVTVQLLIVLAGWTAAGYWLTRRERA